MVRSNSNITLDFYYGHMDKHCDWITFSKIKILKHPELTLISTITNI